jgi:hypothetical protein
MTDEQIKQQIAQSEQDAITLDYTKWSYARRQSKLSTDHNLWQNERDETLARQRSRNDEARAGHHAKLQNERKAKQSETDAQTELELASEKRRLQNEWLANNPTQTPADFEKKAWHLLKENLIEQHNAASLEAEKQRQMETGRYLL